MISDRQFTRQVIARRIAEKRAYPHATAAKNALKKGQVKLRKLYGAINIEGDDGQALAALQRGESVTLKAWRLVKEGSGDFFDPDQFEVAGELVIKLNI